MEPPGGTTSLPPPPGSEGRLWKGQSRKPFEGVAAPSGPTLQKAACRAFSTLAPSAAGVCRAPVGPSEPCSRPALPGPSLPLQPSAASPGLLLYTPHSHSSRKPSLTSQAASMLPVNSDSSSCLVHPGAGLHSPLFLKLRSFSAFL